MFDFLTLSEKSSFGRINRYWKFVSKACPTTVIDTVGYDIGICKLLSIIKANSHILEGLRVSVREGQLRFFLTELISLFSEGSLENLKKLSIFVAVDSDGSVRIPIRDLSRLDRHHKSIDDEKPQDQSHRFNLEYLVIQADPGDCPELVQLMDMVGDSLKLQTIGLLRGCSKWLKSSEEMNKVLSSNIFKFALNIHLGTCNINIDMDEVVPGFMTVDLCQRRSMRYMQWSNASASIETLKMVQRNCEDCDFDGISFLSFLL